MSPIRHPMLLAAACLLALSIAVPGTPPTPPKKQGFDAYPLVRTRNIFDPERQPGVGMATSDTVQPSVPPATNADYAALNGTMITAEKALAFFSGSRPEFNIVLAPNGIIAGARLVKIAPDSIEVERAGKRTVIAVGQTVPLNASSIPTAAPVPSPTDIPSTSTPSSSTPSSSTPASSTPLSGVDREAVMRRMMEKRQQELK